MTKLLPTYVRRDQDAAFDHGLPSSSSRMEPEEGSARGAVPLRREGLGEQSCGLPAGSSRSIAEPYFSQSKNSLNGVRTLFKQVKLLYFSLYLAET